MQRILLLAALALSPVSAFAQALPQAPPLPPTESEQKLATMTSVPQIERIAAEFAQNSDWRRFGYAIKRLAELRPHNGNYRFSLAAAYAQQGMKRESYDALVRLQTSGYAFALKDDKRFAKVSDTRVWEYLIANMDANAVPFGAGKVAYTLPADDLLIESLAYDPKAKQLLAGSAREGKVFRIDAKGGLDDFIAADAANGLWAVMDMAVDAPRNVLYVASAAIPHFKHAKDTDYGRTGVFKFDLGSGKLLAKYEVAADGKKHLLSSIAVTPAGAVFAADGLNRVIYKIDGDAIRGVIANPALTSIRGMAASDTTLYFADFELGIFALDLASGTPYEVAFPENLTLFSIDGMSYSNGSLAVVQNGFQPRRAMRLKLSADGRRIESSQPLDAGRPEFGTPTRGTIGGDRFYFIANTQKAKYDSFGVRKSGEKLEPVRVFSSDMKLAGASGKGQLRPLPSVQRDAVTPAAQEPPGD